eukprot:Rmarinus@m.20028
MAANFWQSSHCNNWLFDRNALINSEGREMDRKYFDEGIQIYDILNIGFCQYIQVLGRILKYRQRVVSTACVYFKRFYLKNSFAMFDPCLIAPTVLYLSVKVEEHEPQSHPVSRFNELLSKGVDVGGFVIRSAYRDIDIMKMEYLVLEVLDCQLIVYHPYRPLLQFADDAKASECVQTAWQLINDSYRTDLSLMYPPYLIAIACLYLAGGVHKRNMDQWLSQLRVDPEEVQAIVQEILSYFETAEKFDLRSSLPPLCERIRTLIGSES